MPFRQIQTSFTSGEIDPILLARGDIEYYYKGGKRLRNVLALPQGGVTRRFGTNYVYTVVDTFDGSYVVDETLVKGVVFEYSITDTFLIILRPHAVAGADAVAADIFRNGVQQPVFIVGNYNSADIADMYLLVAQDRVIILHPNYQPRELRWNAPTTPNMWTSQALTFAYVPTFDFSLKDGTTYRGPTDTFTPSATSGVGITLTAVNAVFTAGHVGGLFFGNGGVFRITSVNAGGTVATGDTVEAFTSTAAIKGVNALLTESAWGDFTPAGVPPVGYNRGWPSVGEFFQNRLVLANSPSNPAVVWFSDAGDFLNFDDSEGLDTNSFALGIGSDGTDEVYELVGSRTLMVLGASSLYSSSLLADTPITPSTAFITEQDERGTADLRAYLLDNMVFFVDTNTQRINMAAYDLATSKVLVEDASIISAHLIDNPVDLSVYRPANNNGSILMVTNADGTLTLYQSLASQNVSAWTQSSTRGTFAKCFAEEDNAWALVKRSISTGLTTAGNIDNVYTANTDFEGFTDVTSAAASAALDVDVFTLEGDYILFGNECPFYRIAITLNTNANADCVLTWEYLNNEGLWIAFTPTDGTAGFTGGGTVVWDLDTDTPEWAPWDVRDYLPPGASLPENTLTRSPIKFWVRARRTAPGIIDKAMLANSAFTSFTYITDSLSNAALNKTFFVDDGDFLVIGHRSKFDILNVVLATNASADTFPIFHYLSSAGTWLNFNPTADGTAGFTGNGAITWNTALMGDWVPMTVDSVPDLYWIRIQRNQPVLGVSPIEQTIYMDITTPPVEDTLLINNELRLYVESLDFTSYMDSQESTTSNANGLVSNLDHLVGNQVYARVDGVPQGPFFVSALGQITVDSQSTDVQVGINFKPEVVPMPVVSRAFFEQNVYQPKHIKAVYVDYYKSLGVVVDGFEIPDLSIDNFTLNQTPIPVTNFWEFTPMKGWNPRTEVVISQNLPLPMTIIGVGYKVEVS